jgi:predicted transposase YbfD/YdcC
MFCQEAIAEKITEGGGNYILRVKKNQKNLLNEVQMAFAEPVFPPRTLA